MSNTTDSAMAEQTPRASSTDWTVEAADAIERAVTAVRTQTVDRAHGISRAVVYGLIAAGFGIPALVLLLIGLFRGLNVAYAMADVGVWASWMTLGGISLAAGLFAWAKRNPPIT